MTTTTPQPRYGEDGCLLTTCCGAYSTFADDGGLMCKACYRDVHFGEGDGSINKNDPDHAAFVADWAAFLVEGLV